jgi:hypothetical protein
MTLPPDLPQVYTVSQSPTRKPWLYFAGGVALIAVALLGFATSVRKDTGPLQLHLRSTLPTILAVGLFTTGYHMARSPRQVVLSAEGLHVRFGNTEKLLPWNELAWAETQTQAITNQKILAVYDNTGKVVLKLPSTLDRFDALAASLDRRFADQPSPHVNALRWRKSRRAAVGFLAIAAFTAAGATWTAWMAYDARRTDELMRTQAVDGEGVIVRKFVAPNGRTHRIEFRVAGASDNAKLHNVEIDRDLWALLESGGRVPVKTVPNHPEIARLTIGQINDPSDASPIINLWLSIGLSVLSLVFLSGAFLGFRGIDISTDPTTGKLKINRLPR